MKSKHRFQGNARTMVVSEPFYVLGTLPLYYYLPLFMQSVGLTGSEMGALNSIRTFCGLLFLLISSMLINRMGRRRSILWTDMVAWAVPLLVWFLSENFWMFALANILNSVYFIQIVAYNCVATEDEEPEDRPRVFSVLFLFRMFGGLTVTAFGFLVERYGAYDSVRWFCLLAGLLFIPYVLIRNRFLKETKIGRVLMEKSRSQTVKTVVLHAIGSFSTIMKRQNMRLIAIINIAITFVASFVFYNVLFVKDTLHFEAMVTLTPALMGVGGAITYFFLLPRLARTAETKSLVLSVAVMFLSTGMLIVSPAFNVWFYVLYVMIYGASNLLVMSYSGSVLMNQCEEYEKADANSVILLVSTLFGIPSGILGGLLYDANPVFPFVGASLVIFAALAAAWLLHKGVQRKAIAHAVLEPEPRIDSESEGV